MHETLKRLFHYKAWADEELLSALDKLGDDNPVTQLAIKALSHSYVVDQIFAAHLRREEHGYGSANPTAMPSLTELSADLRTSNRDYIEYVESLGRVELDERVDFTFTDGAPGRMTREEMLMHVITHGAGHRGQISALMLLNSLPSANDGFATYLHAAEAETRRRTGCPQDVVA